MMLVNVSAQYWIDSSDVELVVDQPPGQSREAEENRGQRKKEMIGRGDRSQDGARPVRGLLAALSGRRVCM